MRTVEAWERSVAVAGAAEHRTVNVAGTQGADALPATTTTAIWDAAEPSASDGFRRLLYAVLTALRQTPWEPLPTLSGWTTGADGLPPAAFRRMVDGTVALRGRLTGAGAGRIAGPFPAAARPLREQTFVVAAVGGSQTARLTVDRDGWLSLDAFGTGAGTWVDLSAVRFDLG